MLLLSYSLFRFFVFQSRSGDPTPNAHLSDSSFTPIALRQINKSECERVSCKMSTFPRHCLQRQNTAGNQIHGKTCNLCEDILHLNDSAEILTASQLNNKIREQWKGSLHWGLRREWQWPNIQCNLQLCLQFLIFDISLNFTKRLKRKSLESLHPVLRVLI